MRGQGVRFLNFFMCYHCGLVEEQGTYAARGWAVSSLLPDFLSHAGFLWPLEQGRALRTEAFTLSPVPVPSQCIFSLPLLDAQALSTPKQRVASGGSKKGIFPWLWGSWVHALWFWQPATGQSALERNYHEGLKNNQRKGVRVMAVSACLAPATQDAEQRHKPCQLGLLLPFRPSPQEPACPGLPPS